MKTVDSFEVNHITLNAGLHLRSVKRVFGFYPIKSYDLRFKTPRLKKYMASNVMHTIEHCLAHFLRTEISSISKDVVSVSPMGCKTGFYVVVKGFHSFDEVRRSLITAIEASIMHLETAKSIVGMNELQCGNPKLRNRNYTIKELKEYLTVIE